MPHLVFVRSGSPVYATPVDCTRTNEEHVYESLEDVNNRPPLPTRKPLAERSNLQVNRSNVSIPKMRTKSESPHVKKRYGLPSFLKSKPKTSSAKKDEVDFSSSRRSRRDQFVESRKGEDCSKSDVYFV